MPTSKFRADINVIGVPLTAITNSTYTDPRQRQLFKNIIYVGALAALLGSDAPGLSAATVRRLTETGRWTGAEGLGLPFSTYRRYLARALEQLTDLLWTVEIGDVHLPARPTRE